MPFSLAPLMAVRGRRVAVLASGDPFWLGAGGSIARVLSPSEWRAFPAPSTFALAASRLGWRIEETHCVGLHAAPFERLLTRLHPGARMIATVRDGAAVGELAGWLTAAGFGATRLTVLEALGGSRERVREAQADAYAFDDVTHPVAVAIEPAGAPGMTTASGLADDHFEHDGQITKRPVRALTLSALAPRPGEVLWDIGAGSGSISVEFLLAAEASRAYAIEPKSERAERVRRNGAAFGLGQRLTVIEASAPACLGDLPAADAVFVGGGASEVLLAAVWSHCRPGTRIVANAVTLETEALLAHWSERHGGSMLRIELAEAGGLGSRRGWRAALPVVQWSVVR